MRTKRSCVLVSLFFICLSLWLIAPAVAQQRRATGAEREGISGYYLIEVQTSLRGLSVRGVVDMLKLSHFTVAEAGMNIVIVKSSGGAGTLAKKVAGFAKHLYRLPIPDSARASCFGSYRPLDKSLAEKWNHEAENYPRKANSRDFYPDKTHPSATETRLKSLQGRLSRLETSADPGKPTLIFRQVNDSLSYVHRIEGRYEVNLSGFQRVHIQAEDGSITGKVTDASDAGIANVWVHIGDLSDNYVNGAHTDSDGNYTVPGLAAGSYKVWFYISDAPEYVREWYNDKADSDTADAVSVTAGSVTADINAQLAEDGSITGKVTDASDAGIEAVWVHIGDLSGNYVSGAYTDSVGNYTVPGLATGSYKVWFYISDEPEYVREWYNDKADSGTADEVPVTAGSVTSGINAELAAAGSITGKVMDASNAGIANVDVYIYDLSYNYVNGTHTDSAGDYAVPVATGSYKVYFDGHPAAENYASEWYNDKADFDAADEVPVTAGSVTSGINAELAAGGSITGKVTDASDAGIEAVWVHIGDLSGNYVSGAYTDSAGKYTVPGLAAGSYKVWFYISDEPEYVREWYNDKADSGTADEVLVTAAGVTSGIDAQLAAAGSIKGKVTNVSSAGIAKVDVYIYDLSNNIVNSYGTDSAGDYEIPVATGSYKVYFDSNNLAENYFSEWYNGKADFDTADAVSVTAGNVTSGIDAQLAAGGSITGQVTNASSAGIEAVWVHIGNLSGDYVNGASTDSAGNYTVSRLAAGSYKVWFYISDAPEYVREWYNDKADVDSADEVLVTAGNVTSGIDAQLAAKFTISGTITFGGSPLAGVVMSGLPGDPVPVTNASGFYTAAVDSGWSGTVTPAFMGYIFKPLSKTYSNVTKDKINQDFSAQVAPKFTISGTITFGGSPLAGVVMSGLPGDPVPVTNASGFYTAAVDSGWSGTVTPALMGYLITSKTYSNVTKNKINQDFKAFIDSTEPNNDPVSAAILPMGTTANLIYAGPYPLDVDWYKFFVPKKAAGKDLKVNVRVTSPYPDPLPEGWASDLDFELLDGSLRVLGVVMSRSDNETLYLHGVASGWYYVNIGYCSTNYKDSSSFARYAVTLKTGTDFGLGYISGRVVDDSLQGIEKVFVRMYSFPNFDWDMSFPTMTTGPGGFFSLAYNPGTYDLYFTGEEISRNQFAVNVVDEYYFDRKNLGDADHLSLANGQTLNLPNVVLDRGAIVSGQVSDYLNNPLGGVLVTGYDPEGLLVAYTWTDASGKYTLLRIPAGGVRLRFRKSGYATQYYNNKPSLDLADQLVTQSGVEISGIDAVLLPQ